MDKRRSTKIPSTSNDNLSILANRIRLTRQRAGLSQAGLAGHADVTASAVAQWENPRGTRPDLDHLIRIAAATKVTLDWLATGHAPRLSKRVQGRAESPAVLLDTFAQNNTEEQVLTCLRGMRPHAQELFVALLRELTKGRAPTVSYSSAK